MALRIAYCGNFVPEHSTENDLRRTLEAFEAPEIELQTFQEGDADAWQRLIWLIVSGDGPDLVLWTRTADLAAKIGHFEQRRLQFEAAKARIPVVAFHLDRWWGLHREEQILTEPFFRCDYVFTADDHLPDHWRAADVNHWWSLPAIAPHNAILGRERREFRSDIAFVGSWDGYGHTEWTWRPQLIQHLRRHWGARLKLWPEKHNPAVRGSDLADLYASTKVVIGDSCLAGGWTRYCSDRIPETLGRGGFLLHPEVNGVIGANSSYPFVDGEHLRSFEVGNLQMVDELITMYLDQPEERDRIRFQAHEHVKANHTYENRLRRVLLTALGHTFREVGGKIRVEAPR